MKILLTTMLVLFLAGSARADLAAVEKIYYDTITLPIMNRLDTCWKLGPARRDACYAGHKARGLRYQSREEYKAEAREMARMSAKLATGEWKIKTAATPAEFPLWNRYCGHVLTGIDWMKVAKLDDEGLPVLDAEGNPVMVNQRAPGRPVETFEECWEAVDKWNDYARQTYARYFSKSWIEKEDGSVYNPYEVPALPHLVTEHDMTRFNGRALYGRYAVQPDWAKQLGFTNPLYAQRMWSGAMPAIKRKLAGVSQ